MPLTVRKTGLSRDMHMVNSLREILWHHRDLTQTLAVIRMLDLSGRSDRPLYNTNWFSTWPGVFETGPCHALDIRRPVDQQAAWLQHVAPRYLVSYPSNLRALAQAKLAGEVALPDTITQVQCISELLDAESRALITEALGAKVVDTYSSQEMGVMAIQAPEDGRTDYLVQEETVFLELVDDQGEAIEEPGVPGQLVVTELHNFCVMFQAIGPCGGRLTQPGVG